MRQLYYSVELPLSAYTYGPLDKLLAKNTYRARRCLRYTRHLTLQEIRPPAPQYSLQVERFDLNPLMTVSKYGTSCGEIVQDQMLSLLSRIPPHTLLSFR